MAPGNADKEHDKLDLVASSLLELAKDGDDGAFATLVAPFRRELHLHCYRMLGSVADADDVMQETLIAAWRGMGGFAGRSSLRTWLYQIATNRCLNAIRDTGRRPPPVPEPPFDPPRPSRRADVTWLQPYPDTWLDASAGPSARVESREAIHLAFITALQRIPPRQSAVLVLCDVLGFPLGEVAAMLGVTPTAAKGLRQRARAGLERQDPRAKASTAASGSAEEQDLARRFADAYGTDDVEAVVRLLTDDAWLAMPPAPHEYHGALAIADFLRASAAGRGGTRLGLVPTRANGQPAFTCFLGSPGDPTATPSGVVVLGIDGARIRSVTRFLEPALVAIFAVDPGVIRGHTDPPRTAPAPRRPRGLRPT